MATWWLAMGIVPNHPIAIPMTPKTPNSSRNCAPMGAPMRNIRSSGANAIAPGRSGQK